MTGARVNVLRAKPKGLRSSTIDLQSLHRRRARCRATDGNLSARQRNFFADNFVRTKTLNPILFYLRYEISFRDGSRIVPFIAYLGRLRESARLRNARTAERIYCDRPRHGLSFFSRPFPSPVTLFFSSSSSSLLHVSSFHSRLFPPRPDPHPLFHLSPVTI